MSFADAVAEHVLTVVLRRARRTATVTGTSGTSVIVSIDGGAMTLPRLASYTPTVGDVVHIDCAGDGWLVIGKTA